MNLSFGSFILVATLSHVIGLSDDVMARAASPTVDPLAQLSSLTTELSSKVTLLTGQVTALKTDLSHKRTQLHSLNDKSAHVHGLLLNTSHVERARESQLVRLDDHVRHNVNSLNTHVYAKEHGVGLTVRFSQDHVVINQTATSGRYQHLKFDSIVSQVGGSNYNTSTGDFTAPSTGSYAFFLTIERNDPLQNDCVEAVIVMKRLNGGHTPQLGVVTACPSGYASSSNLVVNRLAKGDTVYVQTMHSERMFGHTHTQFTVWKMNRN